MNNWFARMRVSKFRFVAAVVGIAFVSLLVLPAVAQHASAAVAPRQSEAPPGRVLQANPDQCPPLRTRFEPLADGLRAVHDLYGGLSLSVSPTRVDPGGALVFSYTLKPECAQSHGTLSGLYDATLYHAFDFSNPSQAQFQKINSQATNGALNIQASTNLFEAGKPHAVVLVLHGLAVESGRENSLNHNYFASEPVQFTVGQQTQTGDTSLKVKFVNSGVTSGLSPEVFYEYSFSYLPGSGGPPPTSVAIQVDCGGGRLEGNNPIPYGGGTNARCIYPKDPKQYTITFQAVDTSQNPPTAIQSAKDQAIINVSGNEANTPPDLRSTTPDLGATGLGVINFILGAIVKAFNAVVVRAVLWIIGPFIETILSIPTYTDDFAEVIYPAWEIFRNLGNIFFILAIVAIGVATVFRISGWAVKDLLVKLIVGAILINFSLTIAQSILGMADTLQNQFLYTDPSGGGNGAVRVIANHLFTADIWRDVPGATLGTFDDTIRIFINFWLIFAAFIAFLGIAALLLFRVIILWILLMLSPLPFVAMVLPVTKKLSHKWWSELFRWAFITPVVAFMLNLTALITEQNKNFFAQLTTVNPTANSSMINSVMFAAASNMIPLGLMYMTLKSASAFGKGTAGFIDKALDKGARAAFWPAAATAGAAGAYAVGAAKGVGERAKLRLGEQWTKRVTLPSAMKVQSGEAGMVRRGFYKVLNRGAIMDARKERLKETIADATGKKKEAAKYIEANTTLFGKDGLKRFGANLKLKAGKFGMGEAAGLQDKYGDKAQAAGLYEKLLAPEALAQKQAALAASGFGGQDLKALKDTADKKIGVNEQADVSVGNEEEADRLLKGVHKAFEAEIAATEANPDYNETEKVQRVEQLRRQKEAIEGSIADRAADGKVAIAVAENPELVKELSAYNKDQAKKLGELIDINKDIEKDAQARNKLGLDDRADAGDVNKARDQLRQYIDLQAIATPPASNAEIKRRHELTKAAAKRAPLEEYDVSLYLQAYTDAVARGDRYLAQHLAESLEKEEGTDFYKRAGFDGNAKGRLEFWDNFGQKFKLEQKEVNQILKEGEGRIKSVNPFAANAVKVGAEGTYTRRDPGDQIKIAIDKYIGDRGMQAAYGRLKGTDVVEWNNKKGEYEISAGFVELMSRVGHSEDAAYEVWRGMSQSVAKQIATDAGLLKGGFKDAIKALQAAGIDRKVVLAIQSRAGGDPTVDAEFERLVANPRKKNSQNQAGKKARDEIDSE